MQPYFFVDVGKRFVKIGFTDILYIEACRNYIRVVTHQDSHMVLLTMRQLETQLPPEIFCRIHRSYIVSINNIQSFTNDKVYITDRVLPIGVSYNKSFRQKITIVTNDYYLKEYGVPETVITNAN